MPSSTDQYEYVVAFLTEHGDENILALWQDESNKEKFESLSTKKSSAKKKKDPNAPKKPKSSYNCFCEAKRQDVKAKYPDENVLSKLGAEWTAFKALCEEGDEDANEEMEVYKAAAAQSKADYTTAMAAYKPSSYDDESGDKKAPKQVKPKEEKPKEEKPKTAKRPPSNYNLFTKERKVEMSDFTGSHQEFMKIAGDEWKAHKEANDEVFQKYSQMADKLKQDAGIVQKVPVAKKPVKKSGKKPVISDDDVVEEEDVVEKVTKKKTTITAANKSSSPAFKKFAATRRNALKTEMKERGDAVSAAVVTQTLLAEWADMDENDRQPFCE